MSLKDHLATFGIAYFFILLLSVGIFIYVSLSWEERDALCKQCGYATATDYEFMGTKIECDNSRIIDTYNRANYNKWNNKDGTYTKTPVCSG